MSEPTPVHDVVTVSFDHRGAYKMTVVVTDDRPIHCGVIVKAAIPGFGTIERRVVSYSVVLEMATWPADWPTGRMIVSMDLEPVGKVEDER